MLWLCRDAAHSDAGPRLRRGAGDTGWAPPFSPPRLPIPICFQTWFNVLEGGRAAGKTGQWHPHTLLQVMIDKHEEGACFWVRCYLSTPAQSHDSTNPSAFKFRHPDSPLNLLSSWKTLLCCQVRPHWNCSLWANPHSCHAHQWEHACISPNYALARCIWIQISIS